MRIGGIVFVALFGLGPIFFPMVAQPQSASAMLLHGGAGFRSILLAAVFGAIYWFKRIDKTRTIGFGEHDIARAKLVSLDLLAKWIYGLMTVAAVGMIAFLAQSGLNLARIQHDGARVTADVLDIYTDTCGKHGCSLKVKYRFKPDGGHGAEAVTGYAYLANSKNPDDPRLAYARTSHHVPIAYEVSNPNVSALNFNDTVFKVDHIKETAFSIEIFGGMWVLFFGLTWLAISSVREKQIRKVGLA